MVERTFTLADQEDFARLSGDFNPIHVDPIAARRLIFGRVVVHGVHLLLWALDGWLGKRESVIRLTALRVEFRTPVGVGERVRWSVVREDEQDAEIEIVGQAGRSLWAKVAWQAGEERGRVSVPAAPGRPEPCREVAFESAVAVRGAVDLFLDPRSAGRLFPHFSSCLPEIKMAVLLATTRLVGMVFPGLHSIFSGMDLVFPQGESRPAALTYEATVVDPRFSSLQMKITGPGVSGTLKTFFRPPPRTQGSYETLCRLVVPEEFAGQEALVVGGSRGLGEVTAKLLAAGGASVTITFARGAADAQRVVEETKRGGGIIRDMAFDVLGPPDPAGNVEPPGAPDSLYYYATPVISGATRGAFTTALFRGYCDFFVDGFVKTALWAQRMATRPLRVLYPSSVFVEEVPLNMGEYAAAKMAGEVACVYLEKSIPGMKVHRPRFPRMATDQAASLMPTKVQDPASAILDSLRQLRDAR